MFWKEKSSPETPAPSDELVQKEIEEGLTDVDIQPQAETEVELPEGKGGKTVLVREREIKDPITGKPAIETTTTRPYKPGEKLPEDLTAVSETTEAPEIKETKSQLEKLKENLSRLCFKQKIAGAEYYCDGRNHYSVKQPWREEKGQILKIHGMDCDGKCGASGNRKFQVDVNFNPENWVIDSSLMK